MTHSPRPIRVYRQLRKDLDYVFTNYGEIDDPCGGFCNVDKFEELLAEPTRAKANEILKDKLTYYFKGGGYDPGNGDRHDLPVDQDPKLQEIKKRWNIR